MSEQYCQLGGGARYWHTRCVESSRARRETTMMLMHSMNQLASTFIGRLSTGTMAPDDQDADDRSTSNNTSDLDTADCFSSATEGDYTIRSDRGGGGGGGGGGGDDDDGGISGGWIFIIILSSLLVLYLVGGVAFNKFYRHHEGKEIIPNVEFWMALPGLVKDGHLFVWRKARSLTGRGSYEEM